MTKRLIWGLLGASDIAATRMVPAIRRTGDVVASVVSGDTDHAEAYALRNDIGMHHESLDALLSDASIDAVYISSQNQHHCRQAIAAASAGKHVLCEKPVATTLQEAQAMVEACRVHNVVLAVNHHLPAAGTHQTIRALVVSGGIGRPLSVNVRHSTLLPERLRGWRLEKSPGAGVIMDLSCHNASVVNPLLGTRPLDVVASTLSQSDWSSGVDDASSASIRYDEDILVDFQDSFTMPFTPSFIQINGDQGSILGHDVMTPEPIGSIILTDSVGTREIPVADRRHTYDITLERFRSAVHEGEMPIVDGVDAANALSVSLSILEAARTGQRQLIEFTAR